MIMTIANTIAERNIAQKRLKLLQNRKDEMYAKYFKVTAQLSCTGGGHTKQRRDKMAEYLAELTKVNEVTGKSLEEEIEEQRNFINQCNYYIKLMKRELKKTTGIENDIFKEVAINGKNPTKAVNIVAEKYKIEPSTVWNNYYPNVKKEIKKIIKE